MRSFPGRPAEKRFFPLPNELFILDLSPGEIAVYAYLMFCEDRDTYQCWPSYQTIGQRTGMSPNTVRKYVHALEAKRLIETEKTTVRGSDGKTKNGVLLYTIRPIQEAVDYKLKQDLARADQARGLIRENSSASRSPSFPSEKHRDSPQP